MDMHRSPATRREAPRRGGRAAGAALLLATLAAALTACGGQSASDRLRAHLLSATDLPAGWSAAAAAGTNAFKATAPCLSGLSRHPHGLTYVTAAFTQGPAIPNVSEVLASGPRAGRSWARDQEALARCRTATLVLGGTKVQAHVRAVALAGVGGRSAAFAWRFRLAGIRFGSDLVLFRGRGYDGEVSYADLGAPAAATVAAFVRAAEAKAARGSTAPVPNAVSVASAPVRTVQTAKGTVAYRAVGHGRPIVLVTGYSGTMESWDRRFVDRLARDHRVVIFDNAGIGATQALQAPLGVDAMAAQTSALIAALHLRRPDVLGWSMGSMIAQALAVLHPGQVRRLVLCASFPGDGTADPPARAALDAFESGQPQKVMAALFPAGQTAAQNAYLAAVSSYPASPPAPAAVVAAQGRAVDAWWAGTDPAGGGAGGITAPTLVADGTRDALDPTPNSHALAALIPGAKLLLYPDAGHAFLFQDQAAFLPALESFLR
jgi:pimeloyl-ACP methyl ester carboxylesterase